MNSAFFTTVLQGARRAAKVYGVNLTFVGANLDVATQIKQVDDFIQKHVNVLVVQPADSTAIVPAVTDANKAGIPVISSGDKALGGKLKAFIGFNNIQSGVIAAHFMCQQLHRKGDVVDLQGRLGTTTGREKEEGFRQGLKSCPAVRVVAAQPANFVRATAVSVMENIIQAQPVINGVYAANDDMALGGLQALKAAHRNKGVVIVGNDGIADAIAAIRRGDMAGTIATPPYRQGFISVEAAYRIATHKCVPPVIHEVNQLIDRANIHNANIYMFGVAPKYRYWEKQFANNCHG
jgi:ribose transport system substrate-binding protein